MKETKMTKLTFAFEDNGFCRVVFTRRIDGERFVYCWQKGRGDDFEFYRCSTDGEPSHMVTAIAGEPVATITPRNPGESAIGRELNAYLEKQTA
jgi:hypothetical protein